MRLAPVGAVGGEVEAEGEGAGSGRPWNLCVGRFGEGERRIGAELGGGVEEGEGEGGSFLAAGFGVGERRVVLCEVRGGVEEEEVGEGGFWNFLAGYREGDWR
jgi:hypothetical protein